jgi:hypothetical protein
MRGQTYKVGENTCTVSEKGLYLEYIKNSQNSTAETEFNLKMGKRNWSGKRIQNGNWDTDTDCVSSGNQGPC